MLALYWKKQAINDMVNIWQYIAQDSSIQATKLIDLIEAKVVTLTQFPQMGREGRKPLTREWVVHENYIVIYRVKSEQIEILRVKHSAQQWPKVRGSRHR
jgi:addiction module RelE/StbE family toxin